MIVLDKIKAFFKLYAKWYQKVSEQEAKAAEPLIVKVPTVDKVQLKFPASFAGTLNARGSDLVVLEKEIGEGATIGDILTDLALSYTDFGKAVFDPDTGKVSARINFVLNNNLLRLPEVTKAKLNDGDSIIILPVITGG